MGRIPMATSLETSLNTTARALLLFLPAEFSPAFLVTRLENANGDEVLSAGFHRLRLLAALCRSTAKSHAAISTTSSSMRGSISCVLLTVMA